MIYSLHGTLVEKTADMAVVECAGVGYCVSIPSSTAGALPAVGQDVHPLHLYERDGKRCLAIRVCR